MSPARVLATLLSGAAILLSSAPLASAAEAPSPTVWGCYPGRTPNPCDESLETTYLASTVLQKRRVARVENPAKDAAPAVDCFYVYPTVSSALSRNAPKRMTDEVEAIYRYQAARFSQRCRVFAPIYRQATLAGIAAPVAGGESAGGTAKPNPTFELAYSDVLSAWKDYLAHDNGGRGVVLIGHSQGSGMLIRLIREEIDPDPAARALLVSAIVPGANLTVAQGQRTGGDFENVPTCLSEQETGCVMAWSTFSKQPARGSLFGRIDSSLRRSTGLPVKPGTEVVCTSPAALSGDGAQMKTLTRSEPFPGLTGLSLKLMYLGLAPTASTPWISPGERYSGRCEKSNGANVLMLRRASWATVLPIASPWPAWGLHLADINLPLGNLVDIVASQGKAYAAAHPAG